MNQKQILAVLNLIGCKHTNNFASKLQNVYSFIKSIQADITIAEILKFDAAINDSGEVLDIDKLRKEYISFKVGRINSDNAEIKKLNKEICSISCTITNLSNQLWKRRKNKDNSELQSSLNAEQSKVQALRNKVETIVNVETERIKSKEYSAEAMRTELNFFTGALISVCTIAGNYRFFVPMDNKFYYEVCDLLKLPYTVKGAENLDVKESIVIETAIFGNLDKAIKFVSKDDLRPAMTGVCVAIENNTAQIVSTDAHRMYYSPLYECSKKEKTQFIIPTDKAKEISKIQFNDSIVEIQVLSENKIIIAGKTIDLIDARFPDYKVVIPEYNTFMEFEKKPFIENVKAVMPFANKVTNQVTFHLNGSISLFSQDVDFGFESAREIPYVSKTFADTDIAFNGKFLVDAISIFKDKNVKMYSEGKSTRAAIFSNGIDNVLVMPLMIGNY